MASAFGHAVIAVSIGQSFPNRLLNWKLFVLGVICTILPDADVISFQLGVPYEAFWGHRGFSHSLLFATIVGLVVLLLFYRNKFFSLEGLSYLMFFSFCTASHSVLDAMTNGGLGVAFFSPWEDTRYFFPWRPIQVSPIGIGNFFSEWGKRVLLSEFIWIGGPAVIYAAMALIVKRKHPDPS